MGKAAHKEYIGNTIPWFTGSACLRKKPNM